MDPLSALSFDAKAEVSGEVLMPRCHLPRRMVRFAEHKVVDVQPVPDLAVELARWEADRRACRHDGPGRGEGLRR
jgi:hypothetical protein